MHLRLEVRDRLQSSNNSIGEPLVSRFDSQMLLDHSSPAGLNMRDNFVISSHQYGWEVALKSLSVLSNPEGVLFDGFIENTFLWNLEENRRKGKVPYCEPWVGFVHHPPHVPNWPSIAKHQAPEICRICRSGVRASNTVLGSLP